MIPEDQPFLEQQKARLRDAGLLHLAEFSPNISREEKVRFLQSLSLLSVPATYGEAFGLYLLEALAAGVPVVQPRHAAFPEVVEATGGGVLCDAGSAESLADGIEKMLGDPVAARAMGRAGRDAVFARYGMWNLAGAFLGLTSERIDAGAVRD
jgi:glycosyltransferase involved in cell wall biosynthesis